MSAFFVIVGVIFLWKPDWAGEWFAEARVGYERAIDAARIKAEAKRIRADVKAFEKANRHKTGGVVS